MRLMNCMDKRTLITRSNQWIALLGTMIALFMPSISLASGFGGDNSDMLTTLFDGLIQLLSGNYARLIMVVAIIGVGYLWIWKGSIPAGRAISTIIGIGLVFSAGFICSSLGIGGF